MEYYFITENQEKIKFFPGYTDIFDTFNIYDDNYIENKIKNNEIISGRYRHGVVGFNTCWCYLSINADELEQITTNPTCPS